MLKIIQIQRLCRLQAAMRAPSFVTYLMQNYAAKKHGYSFNSIIICARQFHRVPCLLKYNKPLDEDTDSEDIDDLIEYKDERDSKVLKTKVNSLRADLLLKAGLGMARNKIETFFYESKIRVNGKKLQKKSIQLNVGDEIDVVRGFSQANSAHLVIARVLILSANKRDREEGLNVHLRRYKSLLVENYAGTNAYKSSEVSEH